jgi:hypothetical protein
MSDDIQTNTAAASVHSGPRNSTGFTTPKPNRFVMSVSGVLSEWFLLQGVPGLRAIPKVREIPLVGGYFKVSRVVIAPEDDAIIRATTDPKNAFFIGPNHPEFTTDWLLDKYISRRYAPGISSWAAASIINGPLKPFWMANNLIGNNGGERAKRYSIDCALAGKGTLLHPEGTVRWRGDKVFDLLPGIVDMSIEAAKQCRAEGSRRPVFILPLVWKMLYDGDIEGALIRELKKLEYAFKLPDNSSLPTAERYLRLQQNLLVSQMSRFGFDAAGRGVPDPDLAREFFHVLLDELGAKYGVERNEADLHRTLHRLYRASRDAKNRVDRAKVEELQRLASYSPETFEKDFFFQEEIAEGIQFIKQIFFTKGYDAVRASLPKPFGWRTVVIRAAQPIDVTAALRQCGDESQLAQSLLRELKSRMDKKLEELQSGTYAPKRLPRSAPAVGTNNG